MRGILNLDKPSGITSYDAIRHLRRVLFSSESALGERESKIPLGHAGTLDPMASGVLLILFGEATKLSRFLMETDKEYEADVLFGIATDTDDVTGKIISTAPVPSLSREELSAILSSLIGPQEQTPPRFSALKQQGVPLYRLARASAEFEVKPRHCVIRKLELLDWQSPRARIRAVVSSGTYIRAVARDLGRAAGTAATLSGLKRIRSGRFSVASALPLDQVSPMSVTMNLVPIPDALPEMARIALNREQARFLLHGRVVDADAPDAEYAFAATADGGFLCLVQAASGRLRPRRVIYAD